MENINQPEVHTYDLGKFFPETGYSYSEWEDRKLAEFKQNFNVLKIDRCATATGGYVLLVDGYKRGV